MWKSDFVSSKVPLFSGLSNLALHHSWGGKRGNESNREKRGNTKRVKIYRGSNELLEGKSTLSLIGPPTLSQHGILGKYDPAVSCRGDQGSSSCQEGQGGSIDGADGGTHSPAHTALVTSAS